MSRRAALPALAVLAGLTLSAPAALAQEAPFEQEALAPPADAEEPPARPAKHHFDVQMGLRLLFIPDSGFDPYADNNALTQTVISAFYTPWTTRPFSVHVAGEWNFGRKASYARGDATDLVVHRLALGVEGRFSPISRLYFFTKVMPSAIHLRGDIQDVPLNATLSTRTWTWGLDTTGGAALRLGSAGKQHRPAASFWLMLDMGYSFAGEAEMTYAPSAMEDEARRFGAITLPSLRPSGFVTRWAFAVSF